MSSRHSRRSRSRSRDREGRRRYRSMSVDSVRRRRSDDSERDLSSSSPSPMHRSMSRSSSRGRGHSRRGKRNRHRSRSYSRSRSRSRSRSGRHKTKKRRRGDSSDDEYSSDDSSPHRSRRKHKKSKSKKSRKDGSKKKRKKKKDKKHKKRKKDKKKKKKNGDIDPTLTEFAVFGEQRTILHPNDYKEGQHGFIGPHDIFSKTPEFTAWLIEVHKMSRENLLPKDEKRMWNKFCDDWNTGTMPDVKYYDLEKWESAHGKASLEDDIPMTSGNDEQLLRDQQRQRREERSRLAESVRVKALKNEIRHLQHTNKRGFGDLQKKHAPQEQTFEALRNKRRADEIAKKTSRLGKYGVTVEWD